MEKLQSFLRNYPVKTFAKGQVILVEGEVPAHAYVIKKGVIKTYNLTIDGQEKPLSFDIKNEVFPSGWVFKKLQRAQYYYEAFTDCELYLVPREDYLQFIKSDASVLFEVLDLALRHNLNSQMRINALEQSKASEKVLNTLHFLCLRFGKELRDDVVQIQLPLTHQDLANYMGLTRETTGIELKKLEKAGMITYKRQTYIVKTNKLNDLLDEEYDQARLIG